MLDAHVPSTLRAQRAPRVFQRTYTDNPSSVGGERSELHASVDAHVRKHPWSAGGERSEPHAFSNAHMPKDPSSAAGEQWEPYAFSNAHMPTTLKAQAAERSEPHALPIAHIPSTVRWVNLLLQMCNPCISLGSPTWFIQQN